MTWERMSLVPPGDSGLKPIQMVRVDKFPDLDVTSAAISVGATYALVVSATIRRRWLACVAPRTNPGDVLVVPTATVPGGSPVRYGAILLHPGDNVVFSETGDMPWRGAVYAISLSGANSLYWTEAQEWPIT